MTNATELRQKTREELERTAQELRDQIRDMRFKIASRQVSKVSGVKNAKRELARVLTVLNEKLNA